MFCKHCGKQLEADEMMCRQCGTPVSKKTSENIEPEQPDTEEGETELVLPPQNDEAPEEDLYEDSEDPPEMIKEPDPGMGKGTKIVIGVLIALIFLTIAAGSAFFFWLRSSESDNTAADSSSGVQTEETLETVGEELMTQATVSEEETEAVESEAGMGGALSESELAKTIAKYNQEGAATAAIDVYAENYMPGVRNTGYSWDKTLFYTLEDINPDSLADGLINGYGITRKLMRNAVSGNKMEYEIYTNPATGKVNKIVSIEYLPDYLEIVDYYYDDNGQVNFIFQRKDINYIPSYAVPTKDGQRFYFNSDCMTKWRLVNDGKQTNYVIGEASANAGGNPTGTVFLYDGLEDGAKVNYDLSEKRMINAAYNTYHTVLEAEGVSEITGYVYDSVGSPLPGAEITLISDEINESLYRAQTDGSGLYRILVPSRQGGYRLHITSADCAETTVYGVTVNDQTLSDYQDTVYMVKSDSSNYPVSVCTYDALNYAADGNGMQRLNQAAVYIRDGVNHRDGGVVAQGTTDANGEINVELPPGMYTAEIVKDGYDNTYCNFASMAGTDTVQINASPRLAEGEVRIVLTWGSTPGDLDSHLFTPYDNAFGDNTYHIWYGNRYDVVGNNLDVDDVNGYGPETMTVPVLKNGLYKYYVADFTDCVNDNPTSYDMSNSGAMVNVYTSNGLTATFAVPSNRSGVIWEVFEIRNGAIVPIQRYYSNIEDKSWWHNDK